MLWYGRWVTSYKDGDVVQFIKKCDGKIGVGVMKLPRGYFTSEWYIETKGVCLHEEDVLVVSPFEYWYRDNQDKMYDAFLENFTSDRGR